MKYEYAVTKGRGTLLEHGVLEIEDIPVETDVYFGDDCVIILRPVADDCQTGK